MMLANELTITVGLFPPFRSHHECDIDGLKVTDFHPRYLLASISSDSLLCLHKAHNYTRERPHPPAIFLPGSHTNGKTVLSFHKSFPLGCIMLAINGFSMSNPAAAIINMTYQMSTENDRLRYQR